MKTDDLRIRDPFVFAENGIYYLYGSECTPGHQDLFRVYTSTDLENWSDGKVIFKSHDGFWADGEFWAAELHKYNGKYYLFVSFMSRCSQILVCDSPDGIFEPMTDWGVTPSDMCCIDGTFYVDKTGNPYMIFSGDGKKMADDWGSLTDRGIFALPLSKDLKQAVGKPTLLFSGSECSYTVSRGNRNNEINYVCEGPFVYENKNGLYILWSGFTRNEKGERVYMQTAARSENGELDGKWEIFENPLYYDDGGHGMIFKTFDGTPKLILHRPNSGGGNEYPKMFNLEEDDVEFKLNIIDG